jgi:hypothetical protein
MTPDARQDERYLQVLLAPIAKCANYKPKFGKEEKGTSLEQFHALYGADPLYHWVGLDSDLMYAAHKAAGGMTSVYRQLGGGCERLIRAVIMDSLALDIEDLKWSFEFERASGKLGIRSLDARVRVEDIADRTARRRFEEWLRRTASFLKLSERRARELRGAVLEVRQGYKSADSKRQVADLVFGSNASNRDFLPVIVVVSRQVSESVIRRYRTASMLVLLGTTDGSDVESTFTFCHNVVGYDLRAFFERNSARLRSEMATILKGLLSAT